jgi:DNA-binding MarR family transcriptional regulator
MVKYHGLMSASSTDSTEPPTLGLRLAQEVSSLVLALAERLKDNFLSHAAALDLAPAPAKVLMTLEPGEAVPMRALAERIRYDPSNLTTVVDKLEAGGVVERRTDNVDRRVKTLALTERGRELRGSLLRRLAHDGGPIGHLSVAELTQLHESLVAAVGAHPPGVSGPRSGPS